jgi:hypothetical protein
LITRDVRPNVIEELLLKSRKSRIMEKIKLARKTGISATTPEQQNSSSKPVDKKMDDRKGFNTE